jgi:predicted TIM-barrel fold metal-dependent hydrolase
VLYQLSYHRVPAVFPRIVVPRQAFLTRVQCAAVRMLVLVLLLAACSKTQLRKIDVHTHLSPGSLSSVLPLYEKQGIDVVVNLSGGFPGHGLEQQLAAANEHKGHVIVFCTPDFNEVLRGDGYGQRLAEQLEQMHTMGCRGMKIFKALGLNYRKADNSLLAVDDDGLDPLFEKAGKLGMPVLIHTGDPKAFWKPVTPENERFKELSVHPRWAEYGRAVPSFAALLEQFERRVARHPGTTFIGAHFGNDAEDPARVSTMLDNHANLFVETGARIPELGRSKPDVLRDIFIHQQDRILFGTDFAATDTPGDYTLGSPSGSAPPPEEVQRFFTSTWRFFETNDRSFAHPTPIQGDWTIDGIGLPRDVLEKIYRKNAAHLLGLEQ